MRQRHRRRRRRWLVVAYLAALAASHAVRTGREVPLSDASVALPAVDGARLLERSVRVAYREWPGPGVPVVVLHGSPGSGSDVAALGELLADGRPGGRRVVVPDLPGFGASQKGVPDYSIAAHARYVAELLDELAIDRAHLVGFSMGGGVALETAERLPGRVASLTLLASIGVQELELLGDYRLNHALHGLQLAALWTLIEATPHFGLLDRQPLDVAYARNFFDTDQRPLREILSRLTMPTLIIHGEHDPLVPMAAAIEHHRLVAHSELVRRDDDHFTVFRAPHELAPPIVDFLARVDAGTAARRSDASAERRAATDDTFQAPAFTGFALAVATVLLAAATLVSEDLTCIAAGLLVAQGRLPFLAASVACTVGIFVGDLLLYLAGRAGRGSLGRPPLSWLATTEQVERGERLLRERGALVIFLSRFLPGARLPTYVAAGVLGMPVARFALYLLIPVAIWTPLLVAVARLVGAPFLAFFERTAGAAASLVGLLISLWLLLAVTRAASDPRRRRQLVGAWRRWTRWEFWPRWLFYPPVAVYCLWLGLRHRGLTLFTVTNPGMPGGGGFAGESKTEILRGLETATTARFRPLPAGAGVDTRVAQVEAFRREAGVDYPVVVKPDVGERGDGVRIVAGADAAREYFEGFHGAALVQEYIPGIELGVFYARHPDEERGRIFSLCHKELPRLVGDGVRTVEELILADRRAVALQRTYRRRLADRLAAVPRAGEEVALTDIGSHSGGAIFRDAAEHRTAELEKAIEGLAASYDGFFFGRFDLRAPSFADARAGRGLRVLELNGVTSEAGHIYDPRYGVLRAWGTLCHQWRLAFEIGAANRRRGHRPVGLGAFFRLLLVYRRRPAASRAVDGG